MQKEYIDDRGILLDIGEEIGSGAEGYVCKLKNEEYAGKFCVKIIDKIDHNKSQKLQYMRDNHLSYPFENNEICWPSNLVYSNGELVGYVMVIAKGYPNDKPIEILTVQNDSALDQGQHPIISKKYSRYTYQGIKNRLKLCYNLCLMVDFFHHESPYIFVDLNPRNILFSLDTGAISFVDLDSIQISTPNNILYGKKAMPDFAPPESNKNELSNNKKDSSWDIFPLGVIIYKIMFGIHPYAASFTGQYESFHDIASKIENHLFVFGVNKKYVHKKPYLHDKFQLLPDSIKNLFYRTFDSKIYRPTAEEWRKEVYNELSKNYDESICQKIYNFEKIRIKQSKNLKPSIEHFPKEYARIDVLNEEDEYKTLENLIYLVGIFLIPLLSYLFFFNSILYIPIFVVLVSLEACIALKIDVPKKKNFTSSKSNY